MSFFRVFLLCILFCLFDGVKLNAQVTSAGKEFWTIFMDNNIRVERQLYIVTNEEANVIIEVPELGVREEIVVSSARRFIFTSTSRERNNIHPVHIISDVDISVYALSSEDYSAEATIVLPVSALGNEYIFTSHEDERFGTDALILITEDGTELEIDPTVDMASSGDNPWGRRGLEANVKQRATFNAGQMIQLSSREDISGTKIYSVSSNGDCKDFAVLGGASVFQLASCPSNLEQLSEQLYPVKSWGKDYFYVSFFEDEGRDILKIVASEDNTEISITGLNSFTLNARESKTIDFAIGTEKHIKSTKPISVSQLAISQTCGGELDSRGPTMVMLNSLEQKLYNFRFGAIGGPAFRDNILVLVTESTALNSIELDGNDVTGAFEVVGEKAFARLKIGDGLHEIKAPEGVVATVYSYNTVQALAYPAALNLDNLRIDITASSAGVEIQNGEVCFNSEILFKAQVSGSGNSSALSDFFWDFGDGTTGEGKEVSHDYGQEGEYKITLIASDGTGDCSNTEETYYLLKILESEEVKIQGSTSVCPLSEEILYRASPSDAAEYIWEVEGGVMVGPTDQSTIKVNWGDGNVPGLVSLTVSTENGCSSDKFDLPVLIDNRLQPILPSGQAGLCVGEFSGAQYSVTPTNGSTYRWFVEGGQIQGLNSGDEVLVNWGGTGGTVWYEERNPSISDCFGVSEKLIVSVLPELRMTETITDVSCNGLTDGSVVLDVGGGAGEYSFVWSNGVSGLGANRIKDLAPGSYEVTVTDSEGCSIQGLFTVHEPDLLNVSVEIQPVQCNGGSDGIGEAIVSGGVEPYTFVWSHDAANNSPLATGFSNGTYGLRVTDSRGCEFQVSFSISEPEVLTATSINSPTCANESSGSIFVEAKGGTEPYIYSWNTTPPQDGQLIRGLPAGLYSVTVIDANGCTFTFNNEEIEEKYPKVFMPNAFTPNGDGSNDSFFAITECSITYFEMKVFNRWGELIFYSDDITRGWNGDFKGEEAPKGLYTYEIAYKTIFYGEPFNNVERGGITLLR